MNAEQILPCHCEQRFGVQRFVVIHQNQIELASGDRGESRLCLPSNKLAFADHAPRTQIIGYDYTVDGIVVR